MPHYSKHYRQRDSGFGALSITIGRILLPLARRLIVPPVKLFSKKILVQAAPEIIDIATLKKRRKNTIKMHVPISKTGMIRKTKTVKIS